VTAGVCAAAILMLYRDLFCTAPGLVAPGGVDDVPRLMA
jgi:hypothetical protein